MVKTTTLEVPVALRDRLARAKTHPRQAYHEVLSRALDALEAASPDLGAPGLDPLVARHRPEILAAMRRHKGTQVWLFGSRAQGRARPDSDVDLLIAFRPDADLLDHAGLQADLEDVLGVAVDTVSMDGLSGPFRDRVLAQRVPL